MKRLSIVAILGCLGGCGDIGSSASGLGSYMPTVNDACESSECITPAGKAASDAIKEQRRRDEKAGVSHPLEMPSPHSSDDSDSIF